MKELISQNIWFLIPLTLLSIISLTIMIERFVYFMAMGGFSKKEHKEFLLLLQRGDRDNLRELCNKKSTFLSRLYELALTGRGSSVQVITYRLEAAAMEGVSKLERRISWLSAISNLSTLLGLFGTVTGMITAFFTMADSALSDPTALAGGISQALVTTAAGLAIAMPSLLAYHFFFSAMERKAKEMDISINEILAFQKGEAF